MNLERKFRVLQAVLDKLGYIVCGARTEWKIGQVCRDFDGMKGSTHPFRVIAQTDYADWCQQQEIMREVDPFCELRDVTSEHRWFYRLITD
jgi:hypothetical protein